ncbi:hypothetical protein PPYR_10714 [Photinus pyralis]|uniref:[acyl-carrier-protein] S-malonyltransferase n=1 Tax=Photinus pyralis TaxID=7054 RepID=A0A5N4AH79_PHOPY|nr:probable malonyl-CoA-acyl carrier protein transacylase, mitochondrial [Photinus pyralis]KAB0796653.1 hypothetical protein PPYR_10714 [Photinus pyralis]
MLASRLRRCLRIRALHTSACRYNDDPKKESPLKAMLDDAASFDDVQVNKAQQQWATLPYLEGTKIRKQGEYYKKAKRDPKDASIILFPGQGNQFVGMGKDLLKFPIVRDLFELANYVLGYNLLKLCIEGPKQKLDQTRYCQPATVVTSLAAIERLKEERPSAIDNCVATAGYSLGEITALIFAGAIGFERGLQLVKIRAEAMQLASEVYQGGMAMVFYKPDTNLNNALTQAKDWALARGAEQPVCQIATYAFPHCKIVAGSIEAIEFLEKNYKELKLKRIRRLQVSGAFHTALMDPAIKPFARALETSDISDPVISVYSNVDGKVYRDAKHIKKQLPKQIVRPIKWEQLLHTVYERDPEEHFPRTFECGPGTSLKTMLKEVNAKAWDQCFSIEA